MGGSVISGFGAANEISGILEYPNQFFIAS
jgi:hypothetical protein